MKTMKALMLTLFTMLSVSVFAHEKTDTFKVYGNCDMCKKKIEKAASSIEGVKKAEWNEETGVMTVTYNGDKTSLDDIQKKIASVGYDTEKFPADDAAYKKLPGCCKYERKPKS